MSRKSPLLLVCSLSVGLVAPALAQGTFIAAPGRVDIVHDAAREVLYISSGGDVLRYHLGSSTFLSPFSLGGSLKGMDLSPDGNTLAVTDATRTTAEVWIWLVDLTNDIPQRVPFARDFMEGGTWSVAYGADGALLVSSTYEGSGWVPMRRYDPATGAVSTVPVPPFNDVRQNSMLASSGDAAHIGWAESNSSGGPFGRFRVADGHVLAKSSFSDGTGWFNYEIGVNADATQYALPTYGGCFITDGDLVKQRTVGTYAGEQPIGVVYHPVEPIVYFAWAGTTEVRAHDTDSFSQLASYDSGYSFTHPGNAAYRWGRLEIARDGSQLFATVGGGVQAFALYAPLSATAQAVSTLEDFPLPVTLAASVGNGGAVSVAIEAEPEHGILTGTAPDLVYTPDPDFAGSDSFRFAASYGRATASATVAITVEAVNDAPVADWAALATDEDTPLALALTGSDPEGSPLAYTLVSGPAHGVLSGSAPQLVYTPAANYHGADQLVFAVSDGEAASELATIDLTVAAVNDQPLALADSAATRRNTGVVISVLANDSDVDGDALEIVSTTSPSQGTVAIVGAGTSLQYTPRNGSLGSDSFTYLVGDGNGGFATATVSVVVTKK